jgi:hypothetical protein
MSRKAVATAVALLIGVVQASAFDTDKHAESKRAYDNLRGGI